MRFAVTILTLSLALAACTKDGGDEVTANADTGLTAEAISANDVTAIDAVTGAAANMAADVDYSNQSMADLENEVQSADRSPSSSGTSKPRASAPRPAKDGFTDPVRRAPDEPAPAATAPPATNQQ